MSSPFASPRAPRYRAVNTSIRKALLQRAIKPDGDSTPLYTEIDSSKQKSYDRVFVLIIKWADELDELDTSPLVKELEQLFTNGFHYDTQIVELDTLTEPRVQLCDYLVQYFDRCHTPNDLGIVYYLGQSVLLGDDEQLALVASTADIPNDSNGFIAKGVVSWNAIEPFIIFPTHISSDTLIILDANAFNYSDNYTPTAIKSGQPLSARAINVIIAGAPDFSILRPDPKLFTSALIDVLEDFLHNSGKYLGDNELANLIRRRTAQDIRLYPRLDCDSESFRCIHLHVLRERPSSEKLEPDFPPEGNEAEKSFGEFESRISTPFTGDRGKLTYKDTSQFDAYRPLEKDANSLEDPFNSMQLGENSSIYYDPDLKSWAKKKSTTSATLPTTLEAPIIRDHETNSETSLVRPSPRLENPVTFYNDKPSSALNAQEPSLFPYQRKMGSGKVGLNDKQSHPLDRHAPGLYRPLPPMSDLSPDEFPGASLIGHAIASRNIQVLQDLLETRFNEAAVGAYSWIKELGDADYTTTEIADLLFEEATDSPWIYFEPRVVHVTDVAPCDPAFHAEGCVHHQFETTPYPENAGKSGSLLRIEEDEFIEEIQELCGLAGIIPTSRDRSAWLGSVNFVERGFVAEVTYAVKTGFDFSRAILKSATLTLKRFSHAFYRLQSAGLCCNSFTVLVQRHALSFPPSDNAAVELRYVSIDMVMELLGLLVAHVFPIMGKSNIGPIGDCAMEILRCVGLSLPKSLNMAGSLHAVALAAQFISLAFLSYNQAHVGSLRAFYLDTPLREILLFGARETQKKTQQNAPWIAARLTRLTCIGNMLRSPVMTFSVHHSKKEEVVRSEHNKYRYDLVATAEGLLDTWGPGSFIAPLGSPRLPCGIRLCGGTIYRVQEDDSLFHWAKNGTQEVPQHTLDLRAKMRIGSLVTVNTDCQIDERACWNSSRSALEYLGVQDNYWKHAESQTGVQAGQYVLLQHNRTRHKIPGKTLKQVLLEQDPQMVVHFLNCLWGVQVSFCTGVTRRVPLRLLMANLLPVFAATLAVNPFPWDSLITQYKVLDAFESEDVQEQLKALPSDILSHLLSLMHRILVTLQSTGIDPDGSSLMVAWPYDHPPFGCFRIPCDNETTSWVRVLADSGDCATFAYITTSCLETDTVKCRGPLPLWHNTPPLLETAILRHNENPSRPLGPLEHKKTYFFKKMDDMLQVTVERRGTAGGAGSAGDVSLYVQPSSIPARFRQRVQRMEILKKRESRIREIREGIEPGAELVTVLAKCERL